MNEVLQLIIHRKMSIGFHLEYKFEKIARVGIHRDIKTQNLNRIIK